jgi:endoglucanase
VWRAGKKIYTKAADDLVGVFAVISTALDLHKKSRGKKTPPFLGLLTRAEEVGFVGAIGHFELDWLAGARRPVIAVSLETSRTLPGALIGKGPVVRLGDRRTVFHPGYLKVLTDVAQDTLPGKHQRRVMDGGSCEATAAITHGLPAIGLSVPLGNYHNEGFEGGPGCRAPRGPAPEFVHLDDIEGLLKLCQALMRNGLPWNKPWEIQRRLMHRRLREYRQLL